MMTNVHYVYMCDTLEKECHFTMLRSATSHSTKYNHRCFLVSFFLFQYGTSESENKSHTHGREGEREKKENVEGEEKRRRRGKVKYALGKL